VVAKWSADTIIIGDLHYQDLVSFYLFRSVQANSTGGGFDSLLGGHIVQRAVALKQDLMYPLGFQKGNGVPCMFFLQRSSFSKECGCDWAVSRLSPCWR